MEEISNNSKFNICASFNLSLDDINCVSLLYQPLIGPEACALYLTLNSLILRSNLKSLEFNHIFLYDMLGIDSQTFLKRRKILEAIGLLSTYANNESYIYLICPPLSPKSFISDGVLGVMLCSKVGENVFLDLKNRFTVEKIDKKEFKNISAAFDDVFTTSNSNDNIDIKNEYIMEKKKTRKINIHNFDFDFDEFLNNIDISLLESGISDDFKKRIIETASVYNLNEGDMASLYDESLNRRGYFDPVLLKKKAKIFYTFKYQENLPKVEIKPEIKNDEFINYLEKIDGEEFLVSILGDSFKKEDVITLNELYNELHLNPSVVKIMVMYVIKLLFKKQTPDNPLKMPPLEYFKKVADDWILEGTTDIYTAYNRYVLGLDKTDKKKIYKKKSIPARSKDKYEIENEKKDAMDGMEVL